MLPPPLGGQGVLIEGNFVLTASHCVRNSNGVAIPTNAALLDDQFVSKCETLGEATDKAEYTLQPLFVDAISDVAILGPVENEELCPREAERFSRLCETLTLGCLSRRDIDSFKLL